MAGSACHGGITPVFTALAIERAHGRESLYVSSDIGAISPGRWQVVQLSKKIGAMSFEKVGADGACASAGGAVMSRPTTNTTTVPTSRLTMRDIIRENHCFRLSARGAFSLRLTVLGSKLGAESREPRADDGELKCGG
jgi:hypothetical protein